MPNRVVPGDRNPRVARLASPEQQSLGQLEGSFDVQLGTSHVSKRIHRKGNTEVTPYE